MDRRARSSPLIPLVAGIVLAGLTTFCGSSSAPTASPRSRPEARDAMRDPRVPRPTLARADAERFAGDVEHRTFNWFWAVANPANGLVPDRWPTPSFSSVAAVGFALTAYPIGVERGWVSRADARARVLTTLQFLWTAPQGPEPTGNAGYNGFFYHFLDIETGTRYRTVELSTIDTTLLLAGVLTCREYFDGTDPDEATIRDLADRIYGRVDWVWAQHSPPAITLGWTPEEGFSSYDWRGYNEAMILYVLAIGSPTHPVGGAAWDAYTSTYDLARYRGEEYVQFSPLFGYQFSHVWIDFRGIRDPYMRRAGFDYFQNSRRAVFAQQAYAIANPGGFRDYGARVFGLTACDGPLDGTVTVGGRSITLLTYAARGASAKGVLDDGTVAPTAAVASLPFAPEIVMPSLLFLRDRYGDDLYSTYGFLDAFNPTLVSATPVSMGRIVPGKGWFDTDYLGIDQGPIVAMIENWRSGLVWRLMRGNPYVVRGLRGAGFTGGWLDRAP